MDDEIGMENVTFRGGFEICMYFLCLDFLRCTLGDADVSFVLGGMMGVCTLGGAVGICTLGDVVGICTLGDVTGICTLGSGTCGGITGVGDSV